MGIERRGGDSIPFTRFALPMTWDFAEMQSYSLHVGGYYVGGLRSVVGVLERMPQCDFADKTISPRLLVRQSAIDRQSPTKSMWLSPILPTTTLFPMLISLISSTSGCAERIGDQYPDVFNASLTPKNDELALAIAACGYPQRNTRQHGMKTGWLRRSAVLGKRLTPDGRMVIVFRP